MALKVRLKAGRYEPVVVCDHCGQVIDEAGDANYTWRVDDQGRCAGAEIFFTHKGCCRPFEAQHGGRRKWAWAPLSCFPIFLAANLGLDLKDAKESAALIGSL